MSDTGVLLEEKGKTGVVTLNRPKALNALTLPMIRAIKPRVDQWGTRGDIGHVIIEGAGGKAFCAGGDIRALHDWGRAGNAVFLDFYREEYTLNTTIKRFPKPYVALLDGITMGGGVGLSVHGSHRVATENLVFAMPETGIGFFPDVGGTWFLPRCPGQTGMYLGLTGARLKAADSLLIGIATHYVPSSKLGALRDALIDAEDIDQTIAPFAENPEPAPIERLQDDIDRHFSADSVEAILASLDADGGEWAAKTAALIRQKSPVALKVTYRQIREGAHLTFEECMALEYRLVNQVFVDHDFFEGIRAIVIDKDQTPRWMPERLEDVSDSMVDAYFSPVEDELVL